MSIKPNIDILYNPAILSHVSPQQKWMLMSTKHMYNNVHSSNISKKEMKNHKKFQQKNRSSVLHLIREYTKKEKAPATCNDMGESHKDVKK